MGEHMIEAILIDLDGTLVDSTPALYQVYLKFLERYGHKGTKKEFESLIGPSIDEIVEFLQKKYELKGSLHDLSLIYVSILMLQGFEGTELFQDADQVLLDAKQRKIKLGIVTSGTRSLVKMCLDPLKVADKFDIIVTSEDVKKAKPNPEMYQIALNKLGVDPEKAVAIEDSEKGVEAARGAGIQVLQITHGASPPKDFKDNKITYLANWKEIRTWLKSK
jgi:HAD superfamily hydrolase (TIGR01509 family)